MKTGHYPTPEEKTLKVEVELTIGGALALLEDRALYTRHSLPIHALQKLFMSRSTEIGEAFETCRKKRAVEWIGNVIDNQAILTGEEKAALYTAALAILRPNITAPE